MMTNTLTCWQSNQFRATIVDALDTLLIMGLKDEYSEARHWVINDLRFDKV